MNNDTKKPEDNMIRSNSMMKEDVRELVIKYRSHMESLGWEYTYNKKDTESIRYAKIWCKKTDGNTTYWMSLTCMSSNLEVSVSYYRIVDGRNEDFTSEVVTKDNVVEKCNYFISGEWK